MKTIKGILSFDPNTDDHATFQYLGSDVVTPPIVWSHNTLDAGRHIGTLSGVFSAGTNGFTSSLGGGYRMFIEASIDANHIIIQVLDEDGFEAQIGFSTLIEIVIP